MAMAPFAGFAKLDPRTVSLLKYVFLALAAAQFGIIKVVPKVMPAKSVDNLTRAAIITFALCESVAVLGLVLFLLAGNSHGFLCFYGDFLGLLLPVFPQIRPVGRAAECRRSSSER